MATTSTYLKYLPAVLSPPPPPSAPAGQFGLGSMLCVFEKILTGIADGVVITHGDNSVMTTVSQAVTGSPLPQTVRVTAGTGTKFLAGSSYTYNGATPEVLNVTAATVNTITAVIRQNHAAGQTIVNSSGAHSDIQDAIAGLIDLYGAWTAPPDYLDWLAQWVALQFDPMWDDYQRRSILSKIVGIYTQRGTKSGLDTYFDLYALAKQRPRVVVDNASKVLFCAPQTGLVAPVSTLVSQQPLVAPQCLAMDENGYLLVGDLGTAPLSTFSPALWRISPSGDYDYSSGPPSAPQPYQPASLNLSAPIAVAVDPAFGGAYLIDLIGDYVLYRLTSPQVGTITLTGAPDPAQTSTITLGSNSYTLPQTGGPGLDSQAAAWAVALDATAPFPATYVANEVGPSIVIAPLSGAPSDDLTVATSTSASLTLTTSGPCYGTSVVFANDTSVPAVGLVYPIAMAVNAAGHPLILDRGATITLPSATKILDVDPGAGPPSYLGTTPHVLAGKIVEPLSMLLRADGSLVVGDGGNQNSTAPADLIAIDTTTWTATSLLSAVPAGANPLVTPTGIVEVDAKHLMVLDAGLRPYIPNPATPFTAVLAQQGAIYSVDLSVAPPVIALATELKSFVYPRAMVGDGNGTLYVCDSGLPDLASYSSRLWRSLPQQFSVVVHFPGNPSNPTFCITLSGTPTTGNQCSITLGGTAYALPETTGNTVAQQAEAWATALNGNPSFNTLYTAIGLGNILCLYPVAGTNAIGAAIAVTSSADMTLTQGLLAMAVALTGTPTAPENGIVNVGGSPYVLPETTGNSTAQQAEAWATTLNATAPFNEDFNAVAVGDVIAISYRSANSGSTLPSFVTSSPHLTLTASSPPVEVGSITLSGTPTTLDTACSITVGLNSYTLAETTGFTLTQQAEAWCAVLNGNGTFKASYVANNSGGIMHIFASTAVSSAGMTLSAVSSTHLALTIYNELQNRQQFLQSIDDVVSDEIPGHARWYLQSELSTQ